MKICSTSINNRYNSSVQSFKGIPAEYHKLPKWFGGLGKIVGEYIGMPEQKLFLASSALMLQPIIDLKYADEDKKTDAAIKSASKAVAGGISGVTIRAFCIDILNDYLDLKNTDVTSKSKALVRKLLMPSDAEKLYQTHPSLAMRRMKQYNMTVGALAAMAVMILFTNKHFDVPVTALLQDFLSGIVKENKTWARSLSDVVDNRYEKLKESFSKSKQKVINLKNKINHIIKTIKSSDIKETDREKANES